MQVKRDSRLAFARLTQIADWTSSRQESGPADPLPLRSTWDRLSAREPRPCRAFPRKALSVGEEGATLLAAANDHRILRRGRNCLLKATPRACGWG